MGQLSKIKTATRKNFTTIYNGRYFETKSTKETVDILYDETGIRLIPERDYNPRHRKDTILQVLKLLNSPERTVFNNPNTFSLIETEVKVHGILPSFPTL